MKTVHLLLSKDGRVRSIYETREVADAKCERYNADQFVAPGEPDRDAPYSVETWAISGVNAREAS